MAGAGPTAVCQLIAHLDAIVVVAMTGVAVAFCHAPAAAASQRRTDRTTRDRQARDPWRLRRGPPMYESLAPRVPLVLQLDKRAKLATKLPVLNAREANRENHLPLKNGS
jgi:hypothetical protein